MLQAANIMQLWSGAGIAGPGLLTVEQRPDAAVLRLRFLQGGGA